jgi:hypothetical protein
VTRQCEILELSRSGIYYTPVPISARDMELMRQIDEIHLLYPFYGNRNIKLYRRDTQGPQNRTFRHLQGIAVLVLFSPSDSAEPSAIVIACPRWQNWKTRR